VRGKGRYQSPARIHQAFGCLQESEMRAYYLRGQRSDGGLE
jgi:hypothetical protein